MLRLTWCTIAITTLAFGCGAGGGEVDNREIIDLEGLLPSAAALDDGWTVVVGPTSFGPERLYEYLNGGAERYVDHGFRRLVHVRYQRGDEPLACVTLDIFDMGDALGAFGIYSAGRAPEWDARPWAVEGYRHGTVAAAWKGPVFVHGVADHDRPELIATLERVVAHVADAVPGDTVLPAMVDMLPSDHLVPRSERHVARDLLGHAFLPGGLLATYAEGDRSSELFVSDLGDAAGAAAALEALRDHVARSGEFSAVRPVAGEDGFRYADPVLGRGVALRSGNHVVGIHGALPPELHDAIVSAAVERLDSGLGR
jgi:hypothetical protein